MSPLPASRSAWFFPTTMSKSSWPLTLSEGGTDPVRTRARAPSCFRPAPARAPGLRAPRPGRPPSMSHVVVLTGGWGEAGGDRTLKSSHSQISPLTVMPISKAAFSAKITGVQAPPSPSNLDGGASCPPRTMPRDTSAATSRRPRAPLALGLTPGSMSSRLREPGRGPGTSRGNGVTAQGRVASNDRGPALAASRGHRTRHSSSLSCPTATTAYVEML